MEELVSESIIPVLVGVNITIWVGLYFLWTKTKFGDDMKKMFKKENDK